MKESCDLKKEISDLKKDSCHRASVSSNLSNVSCHLAGVSEILRAKSPFRKRGAGGIVTNREENSVAESSFCVSNNILNKKAPLRRQVTKLRKAPL